MSEKKTSKKKKEKIAQLRDYRFFVYSLLQGGVVLCSLLIFFQMLLYSPEKRLNKFIEEQKKVLSEEVALTATTVSNYCLIAYVQYARQYTNLLSKVRSSDVSRSSDISKSDVSSPSNDNIVDDYRYFAFGGNSYFSANDLNCVFSVGDTWVDGSHILDIGECSFLTSSGLFFARRGRVHPNMNRGIAKNDSL